MRMLTTRPDCDKQHTARRWTGRRARLVLGLGVTTMAAGGAFFASPAHAMVAGPNDSSATVADSAEAWYSTPVVNTCTTPLGCVPAAVMASPYPKNTLVVGFAAGKQTAAIYIAPNLAGLPYGVSVDGGTVTVPIDTASDSGTSSPSTAEIEACLLTGTVTDAVAGASSTPPTDNCSTSAPLTYNKSANTFTFALTPFATAWSNGSPEDGIALVPNTAKNTSTSFWNVTVYGKAYADEPHVATALTYATSTDDSTTPPSTTTTGTTTGSSTPGSTTTTTTTNAGGTVVPPQVNLPTASLPSVAAPQVGPNSPEVAGTGTTSTATGTREVSFARGFQYPLAFLAPLVLLAGGVFFTRLFTRDATPLGARR